MNLSQLEKANKKIEEIKALDAQIIAIEKHAMLIANGEVSIDFKMSVTDLGKKKEAEFKVGFDEDGSLISPYESAVERMMRNIRYSPFSFGCDTSIKKQEDSISYLNQAIEENAALQILGILLYVKQTRRSELLKSLEKFGIKI